MKRGKTDIRLSTRKTLKPQDLKKMIVKLKTKVYNRVINKHNCDKSLYQSKAIDNLIFNKNTHLSVKYRDDMMLDFTDEFLKR